MSQEKAGSVKPVPAKAVSAAKKNASPQPKTTVAKTMPNVAGTESARLMAESAIMKSRDAYEQAKDVMEDAVETLEASLDKAGTGVTEMNRKVMDITQSNLNSGFELARSLAEARDLTQVVEIQSAFARKHFELLAAQAEEVRTLATKVSTETVEPFRSHFSKTMKAFDTAH